VAQRGDSDGSKRQFEWTRFPAGFRQVFHKTKQNKRTELHWLIFGLVQLTSLSSSIIIISIIIIIIIIIIEKIPSPPPE
jgi:hypothetical protein